MSHSLHDRLVAPRAGHEPIPRRVLKNGLAVYGNRSLTAAVTLRDVTETDARLHCVNGDLLPNAFELLIDYDGVVAHCEVMWRFRDEIGVRFLSRAPSGDLKQQLGSLSGLSRPERV